MAEEIPNAVTAIIVGIAVGVVAGFGTFMVGNPDVTPFPDWPWAGFLPIVLAGVYTQLLSSTLRASFVAATVGFLVGGVVTIALWLSPVIILPYTGLAAELMAAPRLRDAVVDVMTVQLLGYGASYLGTVTVVGFFE